MFKTHKYTIPLQEHSGGVPRQAVPDVPGGAAASAEGLPGLALHTDAVRTTVVTAMKFTISDYR